MAKKVYRSSITGRWVKKSYAEAHPDITQSETAHWLKVVLHRAVTFTDQAA